ncbi:MAG: hypothetical protein RIG84_17810 [Roseovarius sp.]
MRPSRPALPRLALLLVPLVAACSAAPQLDRVVSPEALRADYPTLVPAEQLRVAAAVTSPARQQVTPETAPAIDARASRLKARAAALRGEVIDRESKDRLGSSITIDEEDT